MTQPTDVNMTFDTSLIDLSPENTQPSNIQGSFSTTESDLSTNGPPAPQEPSTVKTPTPPSTSPNLDKTPKAPSQSPWPQPSSTHHPIPKSSTPIQHLPTKDTYDAWASVYDTDGNILQAIDDLQLSTLLPEFLSAATAHTASPSPFNILDLGCGTGRNTAKLLRYPWPAHLRVKLTGVDFSREMLKIAGEKLSAAAVKGGNVEWGLREGDPFSASLSLSPQEAIVSTLVLEHIQLPTFVSTLYGFLAPGGQALVTNMHEEMGGMAQAGFLRADGTKVRGESFVHGVREMVEEAERVGLEVVRVVERAVERDDVVAGRVGVRGEKWVGVRVWFGVWVRRKED